MHTQTINGKVYKFEDDYHVTDFGTDGKWAMVAFATSENGDAVTLQVIPTDDERGAIDNGDADLDFIDYDKAQVILY